MTTRHSSTEAAVICFKMHGNPSHVMVRTSISSHSAAVRKLLPGGGVGMPRRVEGLVRSRGWASHCSISPSLMPLGRGVVVGVWLQALTLRAIAITPVEVRRTMRCRFMVER